MAQRFFMTLSMGLTSPRYCFVFHSNLNITNDWLWSVTAINNHYEVIAADMGVATGMNDFLWSIFVKFSCAWTECHVGDSVQGNTQLEQHPLLCQCCQLLPHNATAAIIVGSLLESASLKRPPRHTAVNRVALTTTDTQNIITIVKQMVRHPSLHQK